MKQRILSVLLCLVLVLGLALPAAADGDTALPEEAEAIIEAVTAEETTDAAPAQAEDETPSEQTIVLRSTEGNFMQGMVMTEGAGGSNAVALIAALYAWEQKTEGITKYLSQYAAAEKAKWNKLLQTEEYILQEAAKQYGFCDRPEEGYLFYTAAREFKWHQAGAAGAVEDYTGDVDGDTWRALGLDIKETFEDAFKTWSGDWAGGGLSPIKMQLKGNTLTLDYSPLFYVTPDFGSGALTDEEIKYVIEQCVIGFKEWEGTYDVYGQPLELVLNVTPGITNYKLFADVKILPEDDLASMVPGCIIWKPRSPFLGMYIKTDDPVNDYWLDYSAMHEFGHVLGLFDAYGYGSHTRGVTILGIDISDWGDKYLPSAPYDRAPSNCVMRSGWRISSTEIEMLLWGWKEQRLQLYTESILTRLGAVVSQAFFH